MGCKPEEATEDCWSYPPRFRFKYEYDIAAETRTEVTITFNGVTSPRDGNPHIDKIILKKPSK